MTGKVCVVGSFMMDLVASAPRRPGTGETLIGTDFAMRLGGKGFNQAVAAVRAGAAASMVGLLGADDFGSAFRTALRDDGIDETCVDVCESAGTGVGLPVIEPDGQNSIIVIPRANGHVGVSHIGRAAEAIGSADVLLLQLELSVDVALAAALLAREAGTTVVLNPAPAAELPAELLACTDVLVPNEFELGALLGRSVDAEVWGAAREALNRWSVDLVVTCGSRGALVLERGRGVNHIPGIPVRAVDTVGAGDTFCGYLGARLADGDSLMEAASLANRAAALAVTRSGPAGSAPVREELNHWNPGRSVVGAGRG